MAGRHTPNSVGQADARGLSSRSRALVGGRGLYGWRSWLNRWWNLGHRLRQIRRTALWMLILVALLLGLPRSGHTVCGDWQAGFWSPGLDDSVWAIARSGSTIYVGGRFT